MSGSEPATIPAPAYNLARSLDLKVKMRSLRYVYYVFHSTLNYGLRPKSHLE
ncbi:MAG: hypothetical protein RM049_25715 [Nostoc sp. DedQUE04]|nr:hypothetical protein [Nostoc sp. DedQUE04]MDZ8138664.1 hypothetical protein [Nostoc sp. DedQUE04]